MSICCSSRAGNVAVRLKERLQRNLGVQTLLIQEDDAPVCETWEEGAAADAILVLLDAQSAAPPLDVSAWASLTNHSNEPPIAFARLEECAYPKLLERRNFLPFADLDRALERWVVNLLPRLPGIRPAVIDAVAPEEWWSRLVDQPGSVETDDADAAHAFCRLAAGHFQNIVWIGCAGRESARIRAEIDHRQGDGRALVVLAHVEKAIALPEGRHSYLLIRSRIPAGGTDAALGACYAPVFSGALAAELGGNLANAVPLDESAGIYRLNSAPSATPELRARHLEIVHRQFQHWRNKPAPCRVLLPEIPAALEYGFANEWKRAVELARRAAFLLLAEGRRREGIRLFHELLLAAEERGDEETAAETLHELSWLTGEESPSQAASVDGEQMSLNLFG